jgi:hypothetical protein
MIEATIMFPADLDEHLLGEAKRRGVSLGQLVRSACEAQYGRASRKDRVAAARQLALLRKRKAAVCGLLCETVRTVGSSGIRLASYQCLMWWNPCGRRLSRLPTTGF